MRPTEFVVVSPRPGLPLRATSKGNADALVNMIGGLVDPQLMCCPGFLPRHMEDWT